MRQFLFSFVVLSSIIGLSGCGQSSLPVTATLPIITNTPFPTQINTSTPTATFTPIPTPTPKKELTIADVGLPFNPSTHYFLVKPCWVYNEKYFHAGDVFMFRFTDNEKIQILAPIDGVIENAYLQNNEVGYQVNAITDFWFTNDTGFGQVRFDMWHLGELESGIKPGVRFQKGDVIGYLTTSYKDPGGYVILDIGLRNTPEQGSGFKDDSWSVHKGSNYFSFLDFTLDDLSVLSKNLFGNVPTCQGNPIP